MGNNSCWTFASNGDDITLIGQKRDFSNWYICFCFFILFYVLSTKIMPLRAHNDEEMQGLDVEECGLEAYPEFKRVVQNF